MNKAALMAAIARAIAAGVTPVDERADVRFGPQVRSVATVNTDRDVLHAVMRAVEAEPDLAWLITSHYVPGPGSGGVGVLPVKVANWLLARTLAVGPDEAVNELERFVTTNATFAFRVVAIYGVYTREPIIIDANTRILPVWEMWPSIGMDHLADTFGGDIRHHLPMAEDNGDRFPAIALLVERFEMRPALRVDLNTAPQWFTDHPIAFARLTDLAYATGLMEGVAPQVVSRWVDPDGLTAIPGLTGGNIGDLELMEIIPRRFRWLAALDPGRASARLRAFAGIGRPLQQSLSVPLKRLSLVAARREAVDRCIELGIALESLFVDANETGGFSRKVAERGASFASLNAADEALNEEWLRAAYDLRSQAAHQGTLIRGTRMVNGAHPAIEDVLRHASALCRAAINRFVDQGNKPPWPP